jgi:drug/metabolite transporter (DMT)-like permease
VTFLALPRTSADRQVLLAFILYVIIGGGASVAIRICYQELAPFWTGASRFGLGALAFWAIAFWQKIPIPRGRALHGALLFGILTIGLAFMLVAWSLVVIPASLFQVLMALIPLFTVFLSTLHGLEGLTRQGVFGSFLAVVGIAITVGGTSNAVFSLPHIAGILVAAALIAEGGVLIKKFPKNPPVMTNAISMTVGALILGIASMIRGEEWNIPVQASTWAAFIYLVIFVTVITFLLYLFVLGKWTASNTSYGFVIVPLVTILIASTLAGERITWNFLVGSAFVLGGVIVGALWPSKTTPEATEACKDRAAEVLPRCA